MNNLFKHHWIKSTQQNFRVANKLYIRENHSQKNKDADVFGEIRNIIHIKAISIIPNLQYMPTKSHDKIQIKAKRKSH